VEGQADCDHPDAKIYRAHHRGDHTNIAATAAAQPVADGDDAQSADSGKPAKVNKGGRPKKDKEDDSLDLSGMFDMTSQQLEESYGNLGKLKPIMDIRAKHATIEEKRIKNLVRRGELIERSAVEDHIFSYFDMLQTRLLNDAPGTIASALKELFAGGAGLEVGRTEVTQVISTIIGTGQEEVAKRMAHV
jgi:hypothetical protein